MIQAITSLVGMGVAVTPRDEETFVRELRHVPEGWLAVLGLALLVGLCWAVVWMYRHEGRVGASQRVRMFLAVVRCAVIVALAVILLEPVRVRILRRWIDSYTIVLVDDSSSMDLTDQYDDPGRRADVSGVTGRTEIEEVRRRDIAETLLTREDSTFLDNLAKRNRVKVYRFSDEPELVGTIRSRRELGGEVDDEKLTARADRLSLALSGKGPVTNVERAVRRAVDSVGSAPVAGVVVVTDGGFNQGAGAESVARFAASRRLGLHVVGVGDPAAPRNVSVASVDGPENAFKQDPFAITAGVFAQGMTGRTITVELRERQAEAPGEGLVVDRKSVIVPRDGGLEPVTFERRKDRTGRFVYEVRVPDDGKESVSDDNSKQLTVNVIDSRTRVLIIAGSPSWDYRFVSRLLERDETFDVSCWLQSADLSAVRDGNTIIDHMPRLAEELYEYDAILLMDPDRAEFDDQWCRLVDTWITEHGGGLLYSAARAFAPDFLRDKSLAGLQEVLPVTLDPEADLLLNRIGHYQLQGSDIVIPESAAGHPILRMGPDAMSTRQAWRDDFQVFWHYPVLREKPVATVLFRHGDSRMRNTYGAHVLGAVQYVGAGRTAFLAFDGTWRWRRTAAQRFDRFWVQLVRYIAEGKLLGGSRRGSIQTESDQFALGDAVNIAARLFDARYEPLVREQVIARVESRGQRFDLVLTARPDRPGWYEGTFVPDSTGSYRIFLTVPAAGDAEPVEISKEINVSRPNIEILNPQMNLSAMRTLAEESTGGAYYELGEAANLADAIDDLHEEVVVRSRPSSLWDNSAVLAFLLGLLVVEWGVRKWSKLL